MRQVLVVLLPKPGSASKPEHESQGAGLPLSDSSTQEPEAGQKPFEPTVFAQHKSALAISQKCQWIFCFRRRSTVYFLIEYRAKKTFVKKSQNLKAF